MKTCSECRESFPRTADYFPRHRARPDGLCCYCFACHRVLNRKAYYARMECEAERVKYAQRQRENHRIRTERASGTLAVAKSQTTAMGAYIGPSKVEVVDAEPLREFIRTAFPDTNANALAAKIAFAISDRRLRDLLNGQPKIELDTADRFFTVGLGRPDLLNATYPI